jgi:Alpha-amylase/alpha-mannosidase
LLDRKDKEVLVEWGIKHFERHFERYPEGMWLPEMAVDVETLEVLAQYDIKFTILTQRQIKGGGPGGPYEVLLPSGRKILVFVRDEALSDKIAFGGPDELPKAMEAAPRDGVTLVALDGETFGHHKKGEERVLAIATAKYGAYMANLGHAADRIKPLGVVEIVPGTSWSCPHGLGRWTRDCGCGGPAPWRQPLREAINWLNDAVDEAFERWSNSRGVDGWMLLRKYVEVLLGGEGGGLREGGGPLDTSPRAVGHAGDGAGQTGREHQRRLVFRQAGPRGRHIGQVGRARAGAARR